MGSRRVVGSRVLVSVAATRGIEIGVAGRVQIRRRVEVGDSGIHVGVHLRRIVRVVATARGKSGERNRDGKLAGQLHQYSLLVWVSGAQRFPRRSVPKK